MKGTSENPGIARTEPRQASPYFRAGENIPTSGIYRVYHVDHRNSHCLTLLAGHAFPRCARCDDKVHFELIAEAPEIANDSSFRSLSLYEIPHPDGLKTA